MPFIPELFSAPVLARIEERRHARLTAVPFFDGLLTGQIDALVASFADEPEVHQPVRGRIKGVSAFERFVTDTTTWMAESGVTVEDVDSLLTPARGVGEFVLHVDSDAGPIELPMALAADLDPQARMTELRIYYSRWPLSGVRGVLPPLLQPDPDLHAPDVVGEFTARSRPATSTRWWRRSNLTATSASPLAEPPPTAARMSCARSTNWRSPIAA
jgi:hypothetical protein